MGFSLEVNELYSAPQHIMGGSVNDETNLIACRADVIYGIYDELKSKYPEIIKKTELGHAFEKSINQYSVNFGTKNKKRPYKICIVTSIHGYEQGCAWTTAQFFKELCEDKDNRTLAFIRENAVFQVVPVLNPWGFEHNDRKNGNKVDLNRNFPIDFTGNTDVEDETYPGTHPLSETETQIAVKFIEDNSDAQLILDYHNIWGGYPIFYVYGERDVALAEAVFTALTKKWSAEYPEFPENEILGGTKPNGNFGMFADYLLDKGLWVLTMETPWCMPHIGVLQYDKATIRCALEVLANTLYTVIKE
jgi:hypothetical protein